MKILLRAKGQIIEADRVESNFLPHQMKVVYEAVFDHAPAGTYTHSGLRYPDGHETWTPITRQTVGWFGGRLRVYGELAIS